jgi:hypothetical protein
MASSRHLKTRNRLGDVGETSAPAPASQLASFIAKFEPSAAKLIKQCRAEMRKLLPTAVELVYDNFNFFVIGYSATERPSDCLVSIAAGANGVGLSFYYGSTLPDPKKLLLGSGAQNRFIRLPSVASLKSRGVLDLIRAAVAQAKTPLANSRSGYLIIKSISTKQRPRRQSSKRVV